MGGKNPQFAGKIQGVANVDAIKNPCKTALFARNLKTPANAQNFTFDSAILPNPSSPDSLSFQNPCK